MSSFENLDNQYFLGIDGGGSKCKAVIADSAGKVLATGVGGPANPLQGFQKSIDSILTATQAALQNAQLNDGCVSQIIAGVGLAGVNLPEPFEKMSHWQHPFARIYLTTDLEVANLGAHNGVDGAVIIVGTGSCGFYCGDDKKISVGGHGFPIGDKASGAWIGLEAVKHTLLVLDGFSPESRFSKKLCAHFEVNTGLALSEKLAGRSSCQFAKIAAMVFAAADEQDGVAEAIVAEGVAYIQQMVKHLLSFSPQRLSMIGGLAKFILPRLSQDLRAHFVAPVAQPEIGALHFARQSWQVEKDSRLKE